MKKILIAALLGIVGAFGLFIFAFRIMGDRASEARETVTDVRKPQNGDIIFQTSTSSQSKAIQLATHSKYSHMGIIYEMNEEYYVFEAVQPVKLTKLSEWISRGQDSHYVIKRLKDSKQLLTSENIKKMKDLGTKFKGKEYDIYFEWSDEKIYCSELVWKIYKEALNVEIGNLQALREFDLTNKVVKDKMRERYGVKIPLAEKVISPEAMFNSDKLITVSTQ
ncbi:MAG: YiiX family permuted papain-like enzyme [Chryseolinea sp.]